MKDSGVQWIGNIPNSWSCSKLKHEIISCDGGVWGNDPKESISNKMVMRSTEQTVDGKWCIVEPAHRDLSNVNNLHVYRIEEGDLLMTKSSGSTLHIGKTSLANEYFTENECYYSNFLQRIRVKSNPKYIWYILNSSLSREQFVYLQNSTSGIGNINAENICNIYIPRPNCVERQKIVNALDDKCEKIDNLIANQQAQIEKLKEYKQSVITEAVTKGLDKKAPMKDSGILHIGNVPGHWSVKKHKYIFKKQKSICEKYVGESILSLTMNGVIVKDLNNPTGKMPTTFDGYQYVEKGNLLLCLFDIDVTPRCVGVIKNNGLTSPAYSQYQIISGDNVTYFYYLLLALDFKKELLYLSKNLRSSLSDELFGLIDTIVPPIDEQQQIVDYLDEKYVKIDKLITLKQEKIEKLQEYKKSLIYEYVTGKKEVV